MLAAEQRATTRRALQEKFGDRNLNLSLERLEFLRLRALDEQNVGEPAPAARSTALSREEEADFVEELRRRVWHQSRRVHFGAWTHHAHGLHPHEQVLTVETAPQNHGVDEKLRTSCAPLRPRQPLRQQSLRSRPRLRRLRRQLRQAQRAGDRHHGQRILVREQLAKNGIAIPQDTYFIPDSTTRPRTRSNSSISKIFRRPIARTCCNWSTTSTGQARGTFRNAAPASPKSTRPCALRKPDGKVSRRSSDWSQVRPEWGLSGNAAFTRRASGAHSRDQS